MTDIGSALLQAILDEPEDDTHRLVYADWLEGEVDTAESRARAELIRVQIRLARQTRAPADGSPVVAGDKRADREEVQLWKHEREMLRRFGCYWVGVNVWWPLLAKESKNVVFCRGFVHHVTCTAEDWLAHADTITACHPAQEVTLTTWPTVITNRGYNYMSCWISGRSELRQQCVLFFSNTDQADIVRALLRRNWPRITFILCPRITHTF